MNRVVPRRVAFWRALEWDRELTPVATIRLSGVLFAVGGGQALLTVWFLTERVQTTALLTSAALALAGAVGMLRVPARHATPELARSTPVLAVLLLSGGAGAWGGALHFYVALYALTFLYAGLTQSRRYLLITCLTAMAGAALSTIGNEPLRVLPFIVCSIATSAFIGLVLQLCVDHLRRERRDLEVILAGSEGLHRAARVTDAAQAYGESAAHLLGADVAMVVVAEPTHRQRFRGVAATGLSIDPATVLVDTTSTDTGIAAALRNGAPLFVADAAGSSVPASSWIAFFRVASILYVPVYDHDGSAVAVLLAWWSRPVGEPSAASLRGLQSLTREATQALHRLQAMDRLDHAARTDALTGLPNRRRLNAALDELKPGEAVVMCDLDHFKAYNDAHGHDAGDRLLVNFSAVLQEHIRGADVACRFGGEEFALVTGPSALAVVERLRAAWREVSEVTFSAGVAVKTSGEPSTVTLARADRALYQAKRAGRDRVVVDGGAVPDPRRPMPSDVQQLV